jgi:hypothetical protein
MRDSRHHDDPKYGNRDSEYHDPRELLQVHRRRANIKDFHSSDSQLCSIAGHYSPGPASNARKPLHGSASHLEYRPSIMELPWEDDERSTYHGRTPRKTRSNESRESPLQLLKLSEQLQLLEKQVEHMTSRQLVEVSEKIGGVTIEYSSGRGLELVYKGEADIVFLTNQVQGVLEEFD